MNKLSWLFITLFVARISIPMGERKSYTDVVDVKIEGSVYRLELFNGKIVYAPVEWTIIEER